MEDKSFAFDFLSNERDTHRDKLNRMASPKRFSFFNKKLRFKWSMNNVVLVFDFPH